MICKSCGKEMGTAEERYLPKCIRKNWDEYECVNMKCIVKGIIISEIRMEKEKNRK